MSSVHFTFLYCLGLRAESAEIRRDKGETPGASGQVRIKYRESLGLTGQWWPPGATLGQCQCHDSGMCHGGCVMEVIDTPLQSGMIRPPTFTIAQ